MFTSKLSIVIPVYNIEFRLFQRCMNSIIACLSNLAIEVIIIDDGSCETIAKQIDEYYSESAKIYHQNNRGVAAARNMGVQIATSKWIFFLDADDYLVSDFSAIVSEHINDKSDVIVFNYFRETKKGICKKSRELKASTKNNLFSASLYYKTSINDRWSVGSCCSKMFKKDFIESNRLAFSENLKYREDNLFMVDVFSLDPKVTFNPNAICVYTRNASSTTRSYSSDVPMQFEILKYSVLIREAYLSARKQTSDYIILSFLLHEYLGLYCIKNRNQPVAAIEFDKIRNEIETLTNVNIHNLSFSEAIIYVLFKLRMKSLLYLLFWNR
ncbi:hypothetical protein FACS1894184_15690 [Clostridia bacterium]|nr:hypothetical protein FACS1894184_15690 [Clostridia bacterium]